MENPSSLTTASQTTNSNPTAIDVAKVAAQLDENKRQIQYAYDYVSSLSTKRFLELRGMKEVKTAWAK